MRPADHPVERWSRAIRRSLPLLHPVLRALYRGALWSNPWLSLRCVSLPGSRCLDLPRLRVRSLVPDFVVIGAQKAGTTSLYHWLGQHPQVFFSSPVKEPGYWLDEGEMRQHWGHIGMRVGSRADLLRRFMARGYRGQAKIGEASTYYTIGSAEDRAAIPARVRHLAPETKLIYLLRHPLERIVSAWLDRRQRGETDADLDTLIERDPTVVATSLYSRHLALWRQSFPTDQLLVAAFEDLTARPLELLREVSSFLDLDVPTRQPDLAVRNRSQNRARFTADELRFRPRTWNHIADPIQRDVESLEAATGRSFGWRFERRRWLRTAP